MWLSTAPRFVCHPHHSFNLIYKCRGPAPKTSGREVFFFQPLWEEGKKVPVRSKEEEKEERKKAKDGANLVIYVIIVCLIGAPLVSNYRFVRI